MTSKKKSSTETYAGKCGPDCDVTAPKKRRAERGQRLADLEKTGGNPDKRSHVTLPACLLRAYARVGCACVRMQTSQEVACAACIPAVGLTGSAVPAPHPRPHLHPHPNPLPIAARACDFVRRLRPTAPAPHRYAVSVPAPSLRVRRRRRQPLPAPPLCCRWVGAGVGVAVADADGSDPDAESSGDADALPKNDASPALSSSPSQSSPAAASSSPLLYPAAPHPPCLRHRSAPTPLPKEGANGHGRRAGWEDAASGRAGEDACAPGTAADKTAMRCDMKMRRMEWKERKGKGDEGWTCVRCAEGERERRARTLQKNATVGGEEEGHRDGGGGCDMKGGWGRKNRKGDEGWKSARCEEDGRKEKGVKAHVHAQADATWGRVGYREDGREERRGRTGRTTGIWRQGVRGWKGYGGWESTVREATEANGCEGREWKAGRGKDRDEEQRNAGEDAGEEQEDEEKVMRAKGRAGERGVDENTRGGHGREGAEGQRDKERREQKGGGGAQNVEDARKQGSSGERRQTWGGW
ncbi:hypothetical protein C8J57DRAFT_1582264 [Mycena rebaudengoi]|nr:hypothetical protein C8J57DRAFT_1582264 [Mycena rebaudengoi]